LPAPVPVEVYYSIVHVKFFHVFHQIDLNLIYYCEDLSRVFIRSCRRNAFESHYREDAPPRRISLSNRLKLVLKPP
jgi:hypothetical protein